MAEAGMIDAARQEEFVGKVVQQISGTMTTLLGAIGDRLGLRRSASFARRLTSVVSGACRWKILSTIYTKRNRKV